MTERPNFLDIEAVIEHVQETEDVVMCQPPAPGATRYLWGRDDGAVFLMHCGKCNYAGDDAVRRFKAMQNGRTKMVWRDSSKKNVMSGYDDQMKKAKA